MNKVFLFINFAKVTNDKNMVLGYFKHELLDEVQTQSVHCCATVKKIIKYCPDPQNDIQGKFVFSTDNMSSSLQFWIYSNDNYRKMMNGHFNDCSLDILKELEERRRRKLHVASYRNEIFSFYGSHSISY